MLLALRGSMDEAPYTAGETDPRAHSQAHVESFTKPPSVTGLVHLTSRPGALMVQWALQGLHVADLQGAGLGWPWGPAPLEAVLFWLERSWAGNSVSSPPLHTT